MLNFLTLETLQHAWHRTPAPTAGQLFEGNETKAKGLINLFLLDFPFPGKIFESGLLHIKHLDYW